MRCNSCDKKLYFFALYDDYICGKCNKWVFEECGDLDCDFCTIRPDKPIRENIHDIIEEAYNKHTEEDVRLLILHYFKLVEEELTESLKSDTGEDVEM